MAETTESTAKANKSDKKSKKPNKGLICGIIAAVVVAIIAVIVALVVINPFKQNLIGTYELTSMEANGEDQSSTVSLMKAFGISTEIEIKDEKSGTIKLFGDESNFTYDKEKFYFEPSKDDEDASEDSEDSEDDETSDEEMTEAKYTFKDNAITLEEKEQKLVFTKKEDK